MSVKAMVLHILTVMEGMSEAENAHMQTLAAEIEAMKSEAECTHELAMRLVYGCALARILARLDALEVK